MALAALPGLVLGACGGDGGRATGAGGGLQVVASFYPVAEAAARVGGDRVEVTNLTPAGTEPHDLELTPDQVDDLEDADLVLYLGQGFQPGVAEIAERRDGATVDLLDGLELEDSEQDGDQRDPHFWLDPRLMIDAVDEIAAALSDVAPDDAAAFRSNARAYRDELAGLDGEMDRGLAHCQRDEIVTSHAAFHYLAARYGLTQLPIAGISPEAEPDADRLADLADLIDEHGITTVFTETQVSSDVADTLARETGAETAVLDPIESLTQEQLDAGAGYVSIMRDDLAALVEALGCPA